MRYTTSTGIIVTMLMPFLNRRTIGTTFTVIFCFFSFLRKDHWLHWLEWWSHTWMMVQKFIQTCTCSSHVSHNVVQFLRFLGILLTISFMEKHGNPKKFVFLVYRIANMWSSGLKIVGCLGNIRHTFRSKHDNFKHLYPTHKILIFSMILLCVVSVIGWVSLNSTRK